MPLSVLEAQHSEATPQVPTRQLSAYADRGVFNAVHKSSLVLSAVKVIRKKTLGMDLLSSKEEEDAQGDQTYQAYSQIGILKTVAHPYILRMMDYFECKDFVYICMEHGGGD